MNTDHEGIGKSATSSTKIATRSGLSSDEFIDEFVRPNTPVVIEDATVAWPALGKWSPEFFSARYGDRPAGETGLSFVELTAAITGKRATAGPTPYLRNVSIDRAMPELRPDIEPEPSVLSPNWFNSRLLPNRISRNRTDLFIGGPGSNFPYLHFDNYHGYAFIFQVYGAKQFVLIPPEQSEFVYAKATDNGVDNVSAVDDPLDPDLDRFPLYAKATPTTLDLTAGQTLFIPAGWWHTARMHEPSISVSSNVANRYNWPMLTADYVRARSARPVARLAGGAYLSIVRGVETTREAAVAIRNRG